MLIHILTKYSIFRDDVEEIFKTFMKASKDNLKDAATKLNTMLKKQLRAEALQKRAERSKTVTKNGPLIQQHQELKSHNSTNCSDNFSLTLLKHEENN